jgi:hypothetical protein
MTNEKEYYKRDLESLRNRAHQCSIDTLSSLVFFMMEAGKHAGISSDVIKEIRDEVLKFKKNCGCGYRT